MSSLELTQPEKIGQRSKDQKALERVREGESWQAGTVAVVAQANAITRDDE